MIQTIFSDYAPNTFPTTEVGLVATISSARKLRACETRCMSEGMCWSCLQALYRVHVGDMCGDALYQLLWAGLCSEWLLHSLESFLAVAERLETTYNPMGTLMSPWLAG